MGGIFILLFLFALHKVTCIHKMTTHYFPFYPLSPEPTPADKTHIEVTQEMMLAYLSFPETQKPAGKLYHILHGAASTSSTQNNPAAFLSGLPVIKRASRKLHFLWVFITFLLQAAARGTSHTYLLKSSVRVELMAWSTLLMASRRDVATKVSPLRPTSVAAQSTEKQQNTINLLRY